MATIRIDIECNTMAELYAHISTLKEQVWSERRRLKIPWEDEPCPDMELDDSNCYGDHQVQIEL